ncbi:Immunoglobulin-like domain, partial [Trinorchestia longiramus]
MIYRAAFSITCLLLLFSETGGAGSFAETSRGTNSITNTVPFKLLRSLPVNRINHLNAQSGLSTSNIIGRRHRIEMLSNSTDVELKTSFDEDQAIVVHQIAARKPLFSEEESKRKNLSKRTLIVKRDLSPIQSTSLEAWRSGNDSKRNLIHPLNSSLQSGYASYKRTTHHNYLYAFRPPHSLGGRDYRGLYQRSGHFVPTLETDHKLYPVQNYQSSITSSDLVGKFDSKLSPIRGIEGSLQWLSKPPRKILFSNNTGATIHCRLKILHVEPSITWNFRDGRPIKNSVLVVQLSNGTLHFPPFSSQMYDSTVHDAEYQCRAASPLGVLVSIPVVVRAVVESQYDIEAYDARALVGNVARLTCAVPSYVKEYVTVTSWVRDDVYNVIPSQLGDAKYHMTSAGDLLVFDIVHADGASTYRCRTVDALSGVTSVSTTARIIVSGQHHRLRSASSSQVSIIVSGQHHRLRSASSSQVSITVSG